MSTSKAIVEQELQALQQEGTVHTLDLADLVMMQMAGNFDEFLRQLKESSSADELEEALEMIEETRQGVTTKKLFSGIVQKTIEAQFGEKHAALRELGQNALDAYKLYELWRKVDFEVEPTENHLLLRVRDYGVGMDLASIIRDLLIPYNSGKEDDLNKIGEHGIGWYSVVDIAELVKVVSATGFIERRTVETLVYNQNGAWKASVLPQAANGFSPCFSKDKAGTEVTAYIPKGNGFSIESIRDFLYQYLGLVHHHNGIITFHHPAGNEVINCLSPFYQQGREIPMDIKGQAAFLRLGASKRALQGKSGDHRFLHRDKTLEKILFTQRGLFIKYDSQPFAEGSIHQQLFRDVTALGLDFWAEVPRGVTLVKGRNDIIADHHPFVVEALYKGFENLFLDVLLEDQELLYRSSGSLLESVAHLFDRSYGALAKAWEEGKFKPGRQRLMKWSKYTSMTLDFFGYIASSFGGTVAGASTLIGRGIRDAGLYAIHDLPGDIVKAALYLRDNIPLWTGNANRAAQKYGPPLLLGTAGLTTLGYASWKVYQLWPKLVLYTLSGIGAAVVTTGVASGMYKAWPHLVEFAEDLGKDIRKLYTTIKETDWKKVGQSMVAFWQQDWEDTKEHLAKRGERIRDRYTSLLNKMGLYGDVEEKRRRKREKKLKRLTRKYLSSMEENEFLRNIMHKKIVPAVYHHYVDQAKDGKETTEKTKSHPSFWNSIADSWRTVAQDWLAPAYTGGVSDGLQSPENHYQPREPVAVKALNFELQRTNLKISIDELVEFYLQGKLKYQSCRTAGGGFSENPWAGDYWVEYGNPLVRTVVDRLQDMRAEVSHTYNVKVLEDYLDNIAGFVVGTAAFAYFLTPIGLIHLCAAAFMESSGEANGENRLMVPFRSTTPYTLFSYVIKKGKRMAGESLDSFVELGASLRNWYRSEHRGEDFAQVAYATGREIGKGAVILGKLPFKVIGKTAELTLEYVLAPIVEALHPQRYPGYLAWCRDTIGYWIGQRQKNFQGLVDQKKKELEEQHRMAIEIGNIPLLERIRDYWRFSFRRLFVHNVSVGLGQATFENVRRAHLEEICQLTGVNQSYLAFIDVVEGMDELISTAVGQRRFTITLSYTTDYRDDKYGDEGMKIDKKGRLAIDLRHHSWCVEQFIDHPEKRVEAGLLLLDRLLHERTHYTLKVYKHNNDYIGDASRDHSRLDAQFYPTKEKLRRQVVQYLQEQGINLMEYLSQYLPQPSQERANYYYHAGLYALQKHLDRSPQQLRYERRLYERWAETAGEEAKVVREIALGSSGTVLPTLPDK